MKLDELKVKYQDLTNANEDVKRRVRIHNNNVLASHVKGSRREQVKNILNDPEIPSYEKAVVVGDRYANYYHTGFILGKTNKDSNHKNVTLDQAVEFLTEK